MQRSGLLRVHDAIQVVDRISSTADPQRSIDFTEADFANVTAADVIATALAALHPDMELQPAVSAAFPEHYYNNGNIDDEQPQQGQWVVPPALVAAETAQEFTSSHNSSSSFSAASGFALPPRASLHASGLRPSAGNASEVYLTGRYRYFIPGGHHRDVLLASSSSSSAAANGSTTDLSGSGAVGWSNAIGHGNGTQFDPNDVSMPVTDGFVPSVVLIKLWSVRDKPSYEVDIRRSISTLTARKVKKIVNKISGIPIDEMEIDIPSAGGITVQQDDARLFPFAYDPTVVPEIRIRSKNDHLVNAGEQARHNMAVLQHQQYASAAAAAAASASAASTTTTTAAKRSITGNPGGSFFLANSDEATRLSHLAAAASMSSTIITSGHSNNINNNNSPGRISAARVEAEYGVGFQNIDIMSRSASTRAAKKQSGVGAAVVVASSPPPPPPPAPGDKEKLRHIIPEQSRDWASWLERRRTARSTHVRQQLVPSSKMQVEIERALQVRTVEDVRRATRNASEGLASASQILAQKLEMVREQMLRQRIGDDAFATTEGARGVLALGKAQSCIVHDGVNREPLVVNLK